MIIDGVPDGRAAEGATCLLGTSAATPAEQKKNLWRLI
jgi:hypothetical protein